MLERLTLAQLAFFIAVVEAGSFSAAARRPARRRGSDAHQDGRKQRLIAVAQPDATQNIRSGATLNPTARGASPAECAIAPPKWSCSAAAVPTQTTPSRSGHLNNPDPAATAVEPV